MNNSQTAFKVRGQLAQFLGIFSPHFSKPTLTFLGDMLYGLQASKDVKLSCIGRGLDEDILLKKTGERLSRNLGRGGLDEGIRLAVAREGAKCRMRHAEAIWRETEEGEKCCEIQYGAMDVRLPHREEPTKCSRNCPCSPQAEKLG